MKFKIYKDKGSGFNLIWEVKLENNSNLSILDCFLSFKKAYPDELGHLIFNDISYYFTKKKNILVFYLIL